MKISVAIWKKPTLPGIPAQLFTNISSGLVVISKFAVDKSILRVQIQIIQSLDKHIQKPFEPFIFSNSFKEALYEPEGKKSFFNWLFH